MPTMKPWVTRSSVATVTSVVVSVRPGEGGRPWERIYGSWRGIAQPSFSRCGEAPGLLAPAPRPFADHAFGQGDMPPAVRGVEVPGLVVLVCFPSSANGAVVVGDRAVPAPDEVAFPGSSPIPMIGAFSSGGGKPRSRISRRSRGSPGGDCGRPSARSAACRRQREPTTG